MKIAAILFDLGDVIMQEESEVKDETGTTLHADLVDGMAPVLRSLRARGYPLALVADTRPGTARNVLHQHGLYDLFDTLAISEEVGAEKPERRIFQAALDRLGVPPEDYGRVVMVGNNPVRDVRGANRMGLISILFHWNDRYLPDPDFPDQPTYQVHSAGELLDLLEKIERGNAEGHTD